MPSDAPRRSTDPAVEVYPGAPLAAVAIEVAFPALLDARSRFGTFQRKHRDKFDRIIFPDDDEYLDGLGNSRATLLLSSSTPRAVAIGADQLVAVTYDYSSGFSGFCDWALPLLEEGLAVLDVNASSVRYRYENIVHPDPALSFVDAFAVHLPSGLGALRDVSNVHLYWKQHWPDACFVDVWFDNCKTMSAKGALELNVTGQCPVGTDLRGAVASAHRCARLTFEGIITDRYRQKLRQPK